MVESPAELAELMTSTPLGGREIASIELPHSEESAFAVACGPDEVRAVWEAGRKALPNTGRWPVVVCSWDAQISSETFKFFGPSGADADPAKIVASSHNFDAATALVGLQGNIEYTEPPFELMYGDESFARNELAHTEQLAGLAPTEAELVAAVGLDATWSDIDRWLMHWREANRTLPAYDPGHLEWFEPVGQPTALVFLPTRNSWESLAYLSFWGADRSDGHAKTVALLRSWNERFGAELVAFWGTMMQFVVERPPMTLDQAWSLANEQFQLAPCTMLLPGVPVGEHARSLVGRDTWFLHERP